MTRPLPALAFAVALALLSLAVAEGVSQKREDDYVLQHAREALRGAPAGDFDARVAALRDYVRARVHNIDFPARGRPFLRDTTADTLRTGKGRCGEAARAFVNLARAGGIDAQRLYVDGLSLHVLALVRAPDGRSLVVDPYDKPFVRDVEPLEGLLDRHEFASYSALGFRRAWLLRSLPSNALDLGPLSYLLENPHALASLLRLAASALALTLAEVLRRRARPAPVRNLNEPAVAALS
jgi:hypothetical protein